MSWKPESWVTADTEVDADAVVFMEADPPDPDWLGSEEQDWSRSLLLLPSVLPVPHDVSDDDPEDVLDGMEDVGDDSQEWNCRSEMEFGLGRSRPDFCRINLESF